MRPRYLHRLCQVCAGLAIIATAAAIQAQVNGITVDAPATLTDTVVNSPFYLQAEAPTCDSKTLTNFGYSVDTGSTTYFGANPIQTMVIINDATGGEHTIHLKAYNGSGNECDDSITVRVGGGVSVVAPTLSATIPGTFNLVAAAPTCNKQGTTEMGYSVDGGQVTTGSVTSYNTQVNSGLSSGAHILRVKAFAGSNYCETDIPFSITGGTAAPSGAYYYANIETDPNYTNNVVGTWQTQPDGGTSGTKSNYSTTYPVTNELYGLNPASRQFTFTAGGTSDAGVRWFNQLPVGGLNTAASISSATHFLYDVYYYIASGSPLQELELDINHAPQANDVYILGVQCGYSSGALKWQVTTYSNGTHWQPTQSACPSSAFSPGWHHVQILTEHNASTITYDTAWLDGVSYNLNAGITSVPASIAWAQSIGPNFQLDGLDGTVTAYASNFFIWYW